jgi:heat shock protein HtpX
MAEPARQLDWRPDPDARSDAANFRILLREPAHSALIAASGSVVGTSQAVHWYDLELAAEALLDANRAIAGTRALHDINVALIDDARRLLRRTSTNAMHEYTDMAAELLAHTQSFSTLLPYQEVTYCLHAALVWRTLLHLLTEGIPVRRIIPVLNRHHVHACAPREPQTLRLQKAAGSLNHVAHASARILRVLVEFAGNGIQTLWMSLHQAWHRRQEAQRADRAAAEARRQAAQQAHRAAQEAAAARQREADAERERRTAAQRMAGPSTHQPLALDGAQLRGSIVGTWFKLVGLSWVSLIWGALISAPFGVGIGIFATLFAGIFVVPAWGTLWGFLGMGGAASSTLQEMGFKPVPADHPLHATCVRYAAALDIPCPQIGLINAHNAFAMGSDETNATVAVGRPLMEQMSDVEVAAILGHELGHVVSGDMRRMMLMRTFQNACVWYGMAQGVKQLSRWVICWAAELSILAFSRRREYWADAIGAALAGKEAMISALRAIERAPALTPEENTHARFMFRGRIASAFSTHPSFDERVHALEAEAYIRKLPFKSI